MSQPKSLEAQREESKEWINTVLQSIAQAQSVRISDCQWKSYDTDGNATTFQLTVIGGRNRRVVKLFTLTELDNCSKDQALRTEIRVRLTGLVTFLGGRSDVGAAKFKRHK